MYSRFSRLAVAGATVVAGLAVATPASASVQYDPVAKTGYVDAGEVRKAFGWTGSTLAARAAGLVFDHDFWTDDTYSVACGGATFPVVHHREYGRFDLTDVVVRATERGAATGYHGPPAGFRLTGAHSGISGTSVGPAVGQPCPADQGQAPGSTIDRVRLVSSTTGWALTATSQNVSHRLRTSETVTPA
jgi:hypothetical protein